MTAVTVYQETEKLNLNAIDEKFCLPSGDTLALTFVLLWMIAAISGV
jgi:hypothetical protein